MKIISCILAIVIFLPTVALLPVVAEEDAYDLRGTTLMPNVHPTDWVQAFNDGVTWLDWGYFHRAVQKEIRTQYGLNEGELYIPGSGKNGGKGFADLYWTVDDTTYLWDVKTALHGYDTDKQKEDLDQLQRYVDANINHKSAGELAVNDPIPTTPTTFTVIDEKNVAISGKYTATYQNAGNGLIFYRFDKIKDDDEPEEEKPPYVIPWSNDNNSNSNKDAENDAIDRSKIITYKEPQGSDKAAIAAALTIYAAYFASQPSGMDSVTKSNQAYAAMYISGQVSTDEYLEVLEVLYGEKWRENLEKASQNNELDNFDDLMKAIQGESGDYDKAGKAQPPAIHS